MQQQAATGGGGPADAAMEEQQEEDEVSSEEMADALTAAFKKLEEEDADCMKSLPIIAVHDGLEEAELTLPLTALLLGDWDDLPLDHVVYSSVAPPTTSMPAPHRFLPVPPPSSDTADNVGPTLTLMLC